jgi:hypothetical protein
MSRLTALERRRAMRKAAMPLVKRLVRKYDRANIAHCVSQLKEHEKTIKRLNELKKEVTRLERSI